MDCSRCRQFRGELAVEAAISFKLFGLAHAFEMQCIDLLPQILQLLGEVCNAKPKPRFLFAHLKKFLRVCDAIKQPGQQEKLPDSIGFKTHRGKQGKSIRVAGREEWTLDEFAMPSLIYFD